MKKSKKIVQSTPAKLFTELVGILATLRGPDGCPWDKRQDHKKLIKYLFSEAEEVRQAVRKKDWANLAEELGDVLLQVVFHSQIAKEAGIFDISDVVKGINDKLRRRHPHVFGGRKLSSAGAVVRQWEKIKLEEKKNKKSV